MANTTMQWNVQDRREQIGIGSIVLDGWELKKLLGRGGYGSAWLAEKSVFGIADQSAIKIIDVPHGAYDLDVMRSEGFSGEEIQNELRSEVENAVREIRTMLKLRSHPAAVSCENFDVVQYEEDETWRIFIRMELLNPLTNWTRETNIIADDVIEMGLALTDILAECEEKKILHRDIKPSNIFVDQRKQFKLGDFGLSRVISDTKTVQTRGVGTESFMAPEIHQGKPYDHRADLYSLGLVMYWMLNAQRFPFAGEFSRPSEAIAKRLSGESLPQLNGIDSWLDAVIRRACDPNPENRWQTAEDFRKALTQGGTSGSAPKDPIEKSIPKGSVEKSVPKGPLEELIKMAAEGDAAAENTIGYRYEKGIDVARNYDEAAKWYWEAAKQGNAGGQYNLGKCYENGYGVSIDYGEAIKWYSMSANQGNVFGRYHLAQCYEQGKGVTQSMGKAKEWYEKAAAQGSEEAKNKFQELSTLYPSAEDVVQILSQFRRAQDMLQKLESMGLSPESETYREATEVLKRRKEVERMYGINHNGTVAALKKIKGD